ncbi:PPE domain-containing protein [Nocardia sp. NPDC006630]|uniref:PPE domain-containing protein n=1 Tax=Nocardia sp. NPDC006630 TaxID=3157181 RepID=UPI0033B1BA46
MAMNVDPHELVGVASVLAALVRATHGALPVAWVPPAGADPVTAEYVPRLNAQKAALANQVIGALNQVHPMAHHIGAAAADYTTTDDLSGRTLGGGGGDPVTNPVSMMEPIAAQQVPISSFPVSSGSVDPLTLARQLHGGPGPGPATEFANELRTYLAGSHRAAVDGLGAASDALQNWTPVGTAVATQLTGHRNQLDELGTGLSDLVDGIDGYSNAFRSAKSRHPTPQELITARQQLLAAMRSKNAAAIAAALATFNELNARSAETFSQYVAEVNSRTTTPGSGKGGTTGAGSGTTTGAGSGGSTTGGSTTGGTTSGSKASSGTDLMSQMLPSLISAMTSGANGLSGANNKSTDEIPDDVTDPYQDSGYPGIPSVVGGGAPGDSGAPVEDISGAGPAGVDVGQMPMVTASATLNPSTSLSRPSAMVPLESAGAGAAGVRTTAGGSPMMPYMPMSPGMGGAGGGGGGERNRVVAWHPDRLMYVDNTPYTEAVIGEKPTIAPTVTPPTPAPATPIPNSSGGSS